MKLTAVAAAIAASAALVSASPLRVIVISNNIQPPDPFAHMRFGHAAAVANPNLAQMMALQHGGAPDAHHRRPCGGRMSGWRLKSIEITNSFRKTFGLPLIETPPHAHPHHPHHLGKFIEVKPAPGFGGATKVHLDESHVWGYTQGGDRVHVEHQGQGPLPILPVSGQKDSFFMRLQLAVMSLGPWEGRAVAFVIGAGIGVLLRMFWVFTVVAFRGFVREPEYTAVENDEDVDEDETPRRGTPISAPPKYVYPVDEKVVYEVATTEAPKAAGPN